MRMEARPQSPRLAPLALAAALAGFAVPGGAEAQDGNEDRRNGQDQGDQRRGCWTGARLRVEGRFETCQETADD